MVLGKNLYKLLNTLSLNITTKAIEKEITLQYFEFDNFNRQ